MNDVKAAAPDPAALSGPEPDDPLWYKDAVIYQLNVKSFFDSNDDGIGDFKGLTSKLDYIRDLGVNTIWLMPFYPSPLKDDGYDISDYQNVHPHYGTLEDFRAMMHEAHRRGLKVVTELVINHTSDQHPWFQAARAAPAGSPQRDFYVWSDTDQKYLGTRIIFTDTETSNWTWDPLAKAYYWHRFFSHQPDLNFDNPKVLEAVLQTMRFWLDMGVDGFRLDAIPYLVEREGTNNENLPETHAVIKQLRAAIDAHYENRFLLAEANQWPEGDLPEKSRRTDLGNGDQQGTRLHVHDVRVGSAGAHQSRHPPPAGTADGERPGPHQAHEQSVAVDAGVAHRVLRRRNRHGRQFLHRRPQRRAHPDAMESGPQCRILARRPAAPVSSAHHGCGVRLSIHQRRSPVSRSEFAAELDQALARRAQNQPGVRTRLTPILEARQPQDIGLPARVRR